jgi:xanthine dehydrogenase YagS FAD-binding subunit
MIVAFYIPKSSYARRSMFLKVRDRESYEFALASAAVGLDLDGDSVRQVRIALGGVATVPWRAHKAEQILAGERLNDEILNTIAEVAFKDAVPRRHNAFKVELGKRTLIRALRETAAMEI